MQYNAIETKTEQSRNNTRHIRKECSHQAKKVNSRLQRLALGNKIHFSKKKKRTVYHLSGNRSDKQEGKCRAVKSTAERGKNIHRVFHY
ncbi:hypothetical protein O3689_07325 [Prevotella nigrescens]|uniref:hypothetical protein n=1 Tax=Prevotella nigrescens TaxID=28133 RepID=UPI0028E7F34E|nr:hypothetical protein [Prevotella nigrescens]